MNNYVAMRTVFILGNGFDMNLGLPTGYQDFYDYYLKQPSTEKEVKSLKDHLEKERYTRWADLELGLGLYTQELASEKEVEIILHDLSDYLIEYLKDVSAAFTPDINIVNRVFGGLARPYSALPGGMARMVETICTQNGTPNKIDVISFNYTDTFERIVNISRQIATLPLPISNNDILSSI